jgi:hypothetical protein
MLPWPSCTKRMSGAFASPGLLFPSCLSSNYLTAFYLQLPRRCHNSPRQQPDLARRNVRPQAAEGPSHTLPLQYFPTPAYSLRRSARLLRTRHVGLRSDHAAATAGEASANHHPPFHRLVRPGALHIYIHLHCPIEAHGPRYRPRTPTVQL